MELVGPRGCACSTLLAVQVTLRLVAPLCLTLFDPMDCGRPGSFVHRIFQSRILEWSATSSSRVSSRPKDWTCVSCTGRRFFTVAPPGNPRGTKWFSKVVAPVYEVVEQRARAHEDNREFSLRLGLVEQWGTLLPGPFLLSITFVPKGEGEEGQFLPVTTCNFPWRALREKKVYFMCSGVRRVLWE